MTSDRPARKFPLALGRLGGASVVTAKMSAARANAAAAQAFAERRRADGIAA